MVTSDEKAFGERIKILIRRVGNSEDLARLTDMSSRVIRQYATGSADPTRKKLLALAKAGNVNIEWLMTGNGPVEKNATKDVKLISEDDLHKILEKFVKDITGTKK